MLSQPQVYREGGKNRSIENFNDLIGNRTHELPAFIIVPEPTTLPLAPPLHPYFRKN
jgi:hypothetical protein